MTKARIQWRPLIAAHFTYEKNGEVCYKRGPKNGLTAEDLIKIANKAYGLGLVYNNETSEGRELINNIQSNISAFFREYGFRDFEGAGGTFHPRLYFIPENKSQSKRIVGQRIKRAQGHIEACQGLSRKYDLIPGNKQKVIKDIKRLLDTLKSNDEE